MMNPNLPQPLPGEDPNQQAPGTPAAPTAAYTKDEVGYRPADNSKQSCGNCVHFLPATEQALGLGLCDLVAGDISPNGVCDLFEASKGLRGLV